jgi:type II secretory pathway pseudopilin PulG
VIYENSTSARSNRAGGFTTLEVAVVVLVTGVVAAIATPKIADAMREYRVGIAIRQMTDLIQRAKAQAVSENHNVTLRIDTANNRAGLAVYDANGNEIRTDYIPLPQGVKFAIPSGMTAPLSGAPTTRSVSFPLKSGSTTVYEQAFNSRGFPDVAPGAINAIYLGANDQFYRALTLSSVGGMRAWIWRSTKWVDARNSTSD